MPGFERSRFTDLNESLAKNLNCSICLNIYDNPIQTINVFECDHSFCKSCVHHCITHAIKEGLRPECPICRHPFSAKRPNEARDDSHLIIISNFVFRSNRDLNNIINDLKIECNFKPNGCQESVKLDSLMSHMKQCEHRFCKSCQFELKCGHNCVKLLKKNRDEWKHKSSHLLQINEQLKDENKSMVDQNRVNHENREKELKTILDSFSSLNYTIDSTEDINSDSDNGEDNQLLNEIKKLIYNQKKEIRQKSSSLLLLSQSTNPIDNIFVGSFHTPLKKLSFEQDHIKFGSITTNTDQKTTIDIILGFNEISVLYYSRYSRFSSISPPEIHIKTTRESCHRIQQILNLGENSPNNKKFDIDSKDWKKHYISLLFVENVIQFDYCMRCLSLVEPKIKFKQMKD